MEPTLFEKLVARAGKDPSQVRSNSKFGKLLRSRGVTRSAEFERIAQLPRRAKSDQHVEEVAERLTQCLRTANGTMRLRPLQALALEELHDFGGLLGPIPVGVGKTLISMLASTVLGSERPVLLIPASLRQKTERDIEELREHWAFEPPQLVHYELISRANNSELLRLLRPDLLIADEAHALKNKQAAVTKRVTRFMKESPDTVFVPLSGTLVVRSLSEYAHLSNWALGALSPVPRDRNTIAEWGEALDVLRNGTRRRGPGALEHFMEASDRKVPPLQGVRQGFRRRLIETPGVVTTDKQQIGASLQIRAVEPEYSEATEAAFAHMHETWETPDEHPIMEASQFWAHARELSCGFYYRWDPRPPDDWLLARKTWFTACREILKYNRRELDSPLQVVQALDRGDYGKSLAADALATWRGIKDTFVPNSVPVWIDDAALDFVDDWLTRNQGVVWCEHAALGKRIERDLKWSYYGRKGLNAHKQFIDDAREPFAASVQANHRGRNLQYRWSKALVTSCEPNGGIWEQLLGRKHRTGQPADTVYYDVFCACIQGWEGLLNAKIDAEQIEHSTKQSQKLNIADLTWPTPSEVACRTEARWKSTK